MRGGLLKLLVVTALAAAGAYYALQLRSGADGGAPEMGQALFPDLVERVNDVQRLTLEAEGETLSLSRTGDAWSVDEWGGYPASFETVKTTIMGVSGLERLEPKTSRPERYADLGVEDPGEGRTSMRLGLVDASGATLARVVVGDRRQGGGRGLYVRAGDDARTWLVDGELSPPRQASGWVARELLRVGAERVRRVELTFADGEVVAAERPAEGGDYVLDTVPEGFQVTSPAALRSLAGALGYLDLEAVVGPADETPADDAWNEVRYETDDGLVILAQVVKLDELAWLRLGFEQAPQDSGLDREAEVAADLTAEDAGGDELAVGVETSEDPEDAAAAAAAEADAARVAAEVADLTARLSPWTYRISTWKADALLKRTDALVRPIEEPGADPAGLPPGLDLSSLDMSGLDPATIEALREATGGAIGSDVPAPAGGAEDAPEPGADTSIEADGTESPEAGADRPVTEGEEPLPDSASGDPEEPSSDEPADG